MRAVCVICGDAFLPNIEVSATPCGHIFHTICVAQWFERSKTCPQCRHPCRQKLLRLYFDEGSTEDNEVDPTTLKHHLDSAQFQVKLKEQELFHIKEALEKEKKISHRLREEVVAKEDKEKTLATLISSLETQVRFLGSLRERVDKLTAERDAAKTKLQSMQELERLVSGAEADVQDVLTKYGDDGSDAARNLATVSVLLTREVQTMSEKNKRYRNDLKQMKEELKTKERALISSQSSERILEQKVSQQTSDIARLEEENLNLSKKLSVLEASLASPSGDVAKGALRRLLHENVTPARLKRHHSADCTPEVITKSSRIEPSQSEDGCGVEALACEALNCSADLFEDSQDEAERPSGPDASRTDVILEQYKLDETTHVPSSSGSPYLQVKQGSLGGLPTSHRRPLTSNKPTSHTIFAKKYSFGSSKPVLRAEAPGKERSYDGLGGHQKPDFFPRPAPVVVKKRRAANPTTIKLRTGSSSTVKIITDFFKNTFDDEGC